VFGLILQIGVCFIRAALEGGIARQQTMMTLSKVGSGSPYAST